MIQFSEENMQILKVKLQIVPTRIFVRPLRAINKIRKFDASSNC
jgi:hypothetical protein